MMIYYLYILECSNNSYYTGYTTDMARRYEEHCNGSPKCKYTRSFPPIRIAMCWEINDELSVVLRLEREIKRLSKALKVKLILNPNTLGQCIDGGDNILICSV